MKRQNLVPNTARLCIMNLYLHGIDADPRSIKSGVENLASDRGERLSVVLKNLGPTQSRSAFPGVPGMRSGEGVIDVPEFPSPGKKRVANGM